jgi:hypothetical protein
MASSTAALAPPSLGTVSELPLTDWCRQAHADEPVRIEPDARLRADEASLTPSSRSAITGPTRPTRLNQSSSTSVSAPVGLCDCLKAAHGVVESSAQGGTSGNRVAA